jgi:hypothetical protein
MINGKGGVMKEHPNISAGDEIWVGTTKCVVTRIHSA